MERWEENRMERGKLTSCAAGSLGRRTTRALSADCVTLLGRQTQYLSNSSSGLDQCCPGKLSTRECAPSVIQ
jgi:hypothetical protein